ncbi:unnamed protein product [Polarella glacialis]|uniref:Uncharacterized protein n=2 Tax=Polarella glacialis TaxID=89957 RepID=A0A813DLI0_POLGL|nr:unnamed protein product [Polarella glacialis]
MSLVEESESLAIVPAAATLRANDDRNFARPNTEFWPKGTFSPASNGFAGQGYCLSLGSSNPHDVQITHVFWHCMGSESQTFHGRLHRLCTDCWVLRPTLAARAKEGSLFVLERIYCGRHGMQWVMLNEEALKEINKLVPLAHPSTELDERLDRWDSSLRRPAPQSFLGPPESVVSHGESPACATAWRIAAVPRSPWRAELGGLDLMQLAVQTPRPQGTATPSAEVPGTYVWTNHQLLRNVFFLDVLRWDLAAILPDVETLLVPCRFVRAARHRRRGRLLAQLLALGPSTADRAPVAEVFRRRLLAQRIATMDASVHLDGDEVENWG